MNFFRSLVLAMVCVPALWAYDLETDASGVYVIAWTQGNIPLQLKMPTSPTLSDGTNYTTSVQAAMQAWNSRIGVVQFTGQATVTPVNPPSGTYASGNGINEVAMDSQYSYGAERRDFGANTLAITVSSTQGNAYFEADVIFNTAYTWNSYRGNLTGQQDIQRVAIHELGHVLGLNHPDQANPVQSVAAIMNSTVSNIDIMQADDIAGARLLYAAPGFVPANDSFANAITMTGSSVQVTGTNVAATKQAGEPNHAAANAPSGHSTWWKWTAPGSGSTTIDTLGSNFDTVLAVYTGSGLTALTAIASNDDTEPAGSGNPQRKRTSTVTFSAVSGTTYFIAVDGWGATPEDQFTYTGAITLQLTQANPTNTAPSITSQPASQTVAAGASVTFIAAANGSPAPTYQWKKDGVTISGATGSSYTIASVTAGDAGNYTVVASNLAGSATSNAAVLSVVVAPSNAVISFTVE